MKRLRELPNGDWADMDRVDAIVREGCDVIVAAAGLTIRIECADSDAAIREMQWLATEVNVGLT